MEMKIDANKLVKFRQDRAWSQQQLADIADLSLRTVQRIEATGQASPESIKAVAAAFDTQPQALSPVEGNKSARRGANWPFKFALSLMVAAAGTFLYMSLASAAPVMLDVSLSSGHGKPTVAHILNESGKPGEIRINKQVKVILVSELSAKRRVRIRARIYAYEPKQGYVLIASPVVTTLDKKSVSIKLREPKYSSIELDITPTVGVAKRHLSDLD